MSNQKKQIGVYLPLFLVRELKIYAAKKATSVSAVIEEAVKKFLKISSNKPDR